MTKDVTVREVGVFRRETETGIPVPLDQVVREGFLEEVTLKEALGFEECRVEETYSRRETQQV